MLQAAAYTRPNELQGKPTESYENLYLSSRKRFLTKKTATAMCRRGLTIG